MSSSFRLQQDVDTASISILDLMLQKVGQLSVYIKKNTVLINGMPTYLIVYSYQMIAGIVIGINFVITFFLMVEFITDIQLLLSQGSIVSV